MANTLHRLLLLLLPLLLPAPMHMAARPEEFIPHLENVDWLTAQTHCREIHHDLMTINNAGENLSIRNVGGWIGLYISGSEWKWSRRGMGLTYSNWMTGEPSVGDGCAYKLPYEDKWRAAPCSEKRTFICYNETLLMPFEEKTWVEALQFCRSLEAIDPTVPANVKMNHRYELFCPVTSDDHHFARQKARYATSTEVWTGLYYLAGKWKWLGGEAVTYKDLPECAITHFCGALSKTHRAPYHQTENCGLRKNFLCRRKEP